MSANLKDLLMNFIAAPPALKTTIETKECIHASLSWWDFLRAWQKTFLLWLMQCRLREVDQWQKTINCPLEERFSSVLSMQSKVERAALRLCSLWIETSSSATFDTFISSFISCPSIQRDSRKSRNWEGAWWWQTKAAASCVVFMLRFWPSYQNGI